MNFFNQLKQTNNLCSISFKKLYLSADLSGEDVGRIFFFDLTFFYETSVIKEL